MKVFWLLSGLLPCIVFCKPTTKQLDLCGCESCPKTDPSSLNVHIVPHSHDDVGWLKTVDQYYYGSKTSIQRAGVQYIISSVVHELKRNPSRRFVQVESAFFFQWWKHQNEETKNTVKELVNNGQLEMIGGAWSMNDEGVTNYQSTIDQFTLGLSLLNDTFGECGRPKVGWQIDPFGHSREQASIFAQLGFDGLLFARLDYRDRQTLMDTQDQDMVWRGSSSLENADLFTSVLYSHYSAPSGFCFDVNCDDDPIIEDQDDPDYNYEAKVQAFADHINERAKTYKTNNLLITMGDDFNYQDANMYFTNIDKLIKGFSIFNHTYGDSTPINIFYSTPSCYVKAVNDEATERDLTFNLRTDDFFPYALESHEYFTGYFSSRPTSKRYERESNNLLQVAKQISVFNRDNGDDVRKLREAVGVIQHHDAITGTETLEVAKDYIRIAAKAIDQTVNATSDKILNILKKGETPNVDLEFRACLLANMSICDESNSDHFVVAVYNPLSRQVSHYVHLPVRSTNYTITDPNGNNVEYQVTAAAYNFSYTGMFPTDLDLIFKAEELPPMGLKFYEFIKNDNSNNAKVEPDVSEDRFVLGNEITGVEINPDNGKLKSVTIDGITLDVGHELRYYMNTDGSNGGTSNAYIFRPDNESVAFADSVSTTTYKGTLFDEIHQIYNDWAKQIIRVYKDESYIEFDWIVGPTSWDEKTGYEIISKFTTPINSEGAFFTDSNGREMLKRIINYRPTYEFTYDEPIAGNYYPISSKIMIKDEEDNVQFSVLNDRGQGGSSLNSGEVELMINRVCAAYDLFSQKLFEEKMVRGQHYVTFGAIGSKRDVLERDLAQKKLLSPYVFLAEIGDADVKQNFNQQFAGLTRSLPEEVQILTLEPWKDGTILLRLEHILEAEVSTPTSIDLNDLFVNFDVTSLRETTLGANQWLEDNHRLVWKVETESNRVKRNHLERDDDLIVDLAPMQIRTFVASITYK